MHVLEVSGLFRTFGVAWFTLLANLIEPNGGPSAWTVCVHARTTSAAEEALGAELARAHKFAWASFERHDHDASCAFYGRPRGCALGAEPRRERFAYQWHQVSSAHEHCVAIADAATAAAATAATNATTAAAVALAAASPQQLFVRVRPDTVLLRPVRLAALAALVARASRLLKSEW